MARRRTINRLDLRAEAEAAEAREREARKEEMEDEEELVEDEDDEEESDDDESPKAKKKTKAKAKAPAKPRTRTAKVQRMKVVWVVMDNSSKVVETFPYNQKAQAEALAADKMAKSGEKKQLFYVQAKKEPMDEK